MAGNSVCTIVVAAVSLFAAVALLNLLTCSGGDCFAMRSLDVARHRIVSHLPSTDKDQTKQQGNVNKGHYVDTKPTGVASLSAESTRPASDESLLNTDDTEDMTALYRKTVQKPTAHQDPVIFGMGFYPDGRFSPKTGFDPYAPTKPPVLPARETTLNILEFGAIGDGVTLNTAAFEAAVAEAAQVQGGALLLVPEGVWLTGCFNLTNHFTLFLESGAVLRASQDPLDWPVLPPLPSYGQGRDKEGPRYGSFIHGENLVDVVITGNNGTIDGRGDPWWAAYKQGQLNHTRGCLVELQWSSRVVISNLTLLDSPFWNVHLYDSHDVTVHGMTILAASHSKNTDGVDPDSCSDVLIEDCYISTGDDAVAIKSGLDAPGVAYGTPTRNVVVRNLVVGRSHGLSVGSEMSGGIANVLFQGIVFLGPGADALRIKSAPGRGGYVTNVTYRDIVMENQKYGISVYSNYRQDAATPPAEKLPRLEGILFQNISGREIMYAGRLQGLPGAPLHGIKLQDVKLICRKRYKCDHVFVEADNAEPPPCAQGWASDGRRGLMEMWSWTWQSLSIILGQRGVEAPT